MTSFGVDTSNHDVGRNGGRPLNYAAMAADGIRFGWHKVSDGLHYYADPTAAAALPAMRAALPVWGGYHVLWSGRSITGQLDWFAAILDRIVPGWRDDQRFVAVWDCERFGYNGPAPTIAQVNEAGDYWLRVTGRKSLGYAPPWEYGTQLDGLRYPLISSNYGANPATGYRNAYPGDGSSRWQATPRRRAELLQYGSRTSAGPHSTLDADAYLGSVDDLLAMITGGAGMAGEADKAFSAKYTGGEPWVSGSSYMARAIEGPLRAAVGQLGALSATVADVKAALAASATREQAALDAIKALATVGGADVAPAVNAINAVGQRAEQQFAALHSEIANLATRNGELERRLAAAAAALASAGVDVPAEVTGARQNA